MARKPRVKKPAKEKPAKERAAKTPRRRPGALSVVVFLLLAGGAGLGGWLTYSYEPAEHGQQTADTTRAVMSIDLTKDGSGEQVAAATPAKPAKDDGGHGEDHGEKADGQDQDQGHAKPAPDSGQASKSKVPSPTDHAAKKKPARGPTPLVRNDQPKTDSHKTAKTKAAAPTPGAGDDTRTRRVANRQTPRGTFTRSGGLRPAPDPALVKSTDDGNLPVVAADGRTPLQVYARPYKATGRPRIALVVGSLGLSQATTLAAVQQLPGGVTLAFAPYGRNLQDYVNQARAAGHEVLLQVPMEPMDYPTNDPGPHTLLTSLTINRNLKRLDWLLGRFTGYVGVVNYMGGRFTSAESHLAPISEAMRGRGLMFLDARASSASVAVDVADKLGLDVAASDRIVDVTASRAAIDARLLELERLASATGGAIGIGFPYPVTIERLAQWTRAMGDRGFDLVPVSALAGKGPAKP